MADDDPSPSEPQKLDVDAFFNRIDLIMAEKEALVRSWTAQSKTIWPIVRKTAAELKAEEDEMFRPQPPYLGVGCPIPEGYQAEDEEDTKFTARAKFGMGLQASKRRDAEEKAESAKRAARDESSEIEGGRSSLGKKKKKNKKRKITSTEESVEGSKREEVKLKDVEEPVKKAKLEEATVEDAERPVVKATSEKKQLSATPEKIQTEMPILLKKKKKSKLQRQKLRA